MKELRASWKKVRELLSSFLFPLLIGKSEIFKLVCFFSLVFQVLIDSIILFVMNFLPIFFVL